jgi:hypothetical protein
MRGNRSRAFFSPRFDWHGMDIRNCRDHSPERPGSAPAVLAYLSARECRVLIFQYGLKPLVYIPSGSRTHPARASPNQIERTNCRTHRSEPRHATCVHRAPNSSAEAMTACPNTGPRRGGFLHPTLALRMSAARRDPCNTRKFICDIFQEIVESDHTN